MTFIYKLIVLLFILVYYGTNASTELENVSDSKDMAIVVNNKLNCSLVEEYFRFIYTPKISKYQLPSNKYISVCQDYVKENIDYKKIGSFYLFIPASLLPSIPSRYKKIAVLHSDNTYNNSDIIFTNINSTSKYIHRLFSSSDSYSYFSDSFKDNNISVESKRTYHDLMDFINHNINQFGILHDSLYPFEDKRFKIVKRIDNKESNYRDDDYYLLSNREYNEYSDIYYHLFTHNLMNDFYWSFPSETNKFTKSIQYSNQMFENKIINEWNITINTDIEYVNDNIQIKWRNCDSLNDYEIEQLGECVNKHKIVKYKLKDGVKCIKILKEEELMFNVGCTNKFEKEMMGLNIVFLIIILIIEILLIIFRNNIVIIKMNRVFPLVIPILSFLSIIIMFFITTNTQTDNTALCISLYLLHFIISSLLSKVIILFFWYNKESVKDPTHFVKHSILSMLLLFLISPDIILYIIMIFVSPIQINSEMYNVNGFSYNLNFCELHIKHTMSILYIIIETFYLFYCFNDIYDLLRITSFESECFFILLSGAINVCVYITNMLLFFKSSDTINHSFTIFLFYSLSNIIILLMFYIPIFVKICKEDKRIAPIESFSSVIDDPFLSYFFQSYSKCNDRYNDVFSFYISCVEYEKCMTREGAELLYEQLFSYGDLPINQNTIDMIQDAIGDRNHPITEDLFTEAKRQVLQYLEEEVYPGFLHSDILNSLYTILPDVQKIEATNDSCRKAMICVITYSMTQRPSNLLPYSNSLHGHSNINSRYIQNKSVGKGLLNSLVSSVLVAEDVIKVRKSRRKSLNNNKPSISTPKRSTRASSRIPRDSDQISNSSIIKPLKMNQLFNVTNEIAKSSVRDSIDKKNIDRKSMLNSFVTDDISRKNKSINNRILSDDSISGRTVATTKTNNNNNNNENSGIYGKRRMGMSGIDLKAFEDALKQLEDSSDSESS